MGSDHINSRDRLKMFPERVAVSMGRASQSEAAHRSRRVGVPFLTLATLVALVLAITGATGGPDQLMWAIVVAVGLMLVTVIVTGAYQGAQRVSIVTRTDSLRFAPPSGVLVFLYVATGVVGLSVALLWAHTDQWSHLPFYMRGAVVVAPLAGLYLIVETLWSLRRAPGLSLSEIGVTGVRGGPRVDLAWDELAEVSVLGTGKRRFLVLVSTDSRLRIPEGATGGDVYAIATVLRYYLENSTERARLREGIGAVRFVESEVRAKRFTAS